MLKNIKGVSTIFFTNEDIVRHPLVTKIVKAFDSAETQEAEKYMKEAYCRRSSIAKLEHKAAGTRCYPDTLAHSPVCGCDACREMRITEHMRWNAYMRGLGYRRADARYDRAMVHKDLKPWGDLPCRERYKD